MTVYTFKKDIEIEDADIQINEEELKKAAAVKATATVVSFFTKPLILMLLWNWLMPGIFGLASIGYLKAFGLYLMSRILFDKND